MIIRLINLSVVLLLVGGFLLSCTLERKEYRIYDTEGGRDLSLRRLASSLAEYDVIVFGEFHGNIIIHQVQAELLPLLHRNTDDLAISMEMFERDVQRVLDDYLTKAISEEEFLANSRPWPNYRFDYRPLIEYAKRTDIPVIASNVPRAYATEVGRFGLDILEERTDFDPVYYADEVTLTEDIYKSKFISTMIRSPHVDSYNPDVIDQRLEFLYAAQSLKDDTMAESIISFRNRVGDVKVIHFNGDFHSNSRFGVVTKLLQRDPSLRVAVISPLYKDEFEATRRQNLSNIADYIIVLEEQSTSEEER